MITQTMTTSFKVECLKAVHDLTTTTGDVFKIALYSSAATLDADTTVYTTTGEITGTNYVAGGATLTNVTPTGSDGHAIASFANASWPAASFTARGALIYNSTKDNKSVVVLDFGSDKTATNNTFLVTMPAVTADAAIVRIL